MKIFVQQGKGVCHEVDVPDRTIKIERIQETIEKDFGVFKRKQKLIFKGKVLLSHQTVEQCKVRHLTTLE